MSEADKIFNAIADPCTCEDCEAAVQKVIDEIRQSARQEGIEQAAKVADDRWHDSGEQIAAAIRTLKDGNEGKG